MTKSTENTNNGIDIHARSVASVMFCSVQPMDCSPPGSSVHRILQARILEWVAIPFSKGSSQPRIETVSLISPALVGGLFTTRAT